jgi:hypothetical protein
VLILEGLRVPEHDACRLGAGVVAAVHAPVA